MTDTVQIDNTLNTATGCCSSRRAVTVESAGFNWRLPKAITLSLGFFCDPEVKRKVRDMFDYFFFFFAVLKKIFKRIFVL